MRKLVLVLFLITFSNLINATKVYYLDSSIDLPSFVDNLKKIKDDEIILRLTEGTYYLNRTLCFNNDYRVPIKIEGRGRVIISGAVPINGWTLLSNGLWRSKRPVDYGVQILNVNGVMATRARTPNNDVYMLEEGYLLARSGDSVEYKITLPEILNKELMTINKEEKPIINLFRHFTHSRANIKKYSLEEQSVYFTEKYTQSFLTPDKTTGIILENYFAALDSPGEWYQDLDGYIYYYPLEGEKINMLTISASRIQNLVTITGKPGDFAGNITFNNLVFEGCGVADFDQGIPPYQSAYTLDASIHATYSKNINIVNCEFRGMIGYAIWFKDNCEDCVTKHNYIHDVGGGGIRIGGLYKELKRSSRNIVVNNNVIRRYGRVYKGATGVFLTFAFDCVISHNDISDGYYSGISVGFSWGYGYTPTHNNAVSYNKIWDIGKGLLNDMAGVYALGLSPETVINNNVIWDVKTSKGGGYGIYTDEGSSDVLIENNVAYYCDGGGFHQHYGSNNIVRNNIFAFGDNKNIAISVVIKPEDVQLIFEKNIVLISEGDAISGYALNNGSFCFKDNCFYDLNERELTANGGSLCDWMNGNNFTYVNDNPRFKRPEQGDFRFRSKRVARKIGFKPIKVSKAGSSWQPKD